jgi:hypothetical protein
MMPNLAQGLTKFNGHEKVPSNATDIIYFLEGIIVYYVDVYIGSKRKKDI